MSTLRDPAGPKVVALGGGHGLYASLSALRRVSGTLTAVVTVADDGGSSGRLRRELGVLPPGDLRMALAALCGDDDWGTTWSRVVQHRFDGDSELSGHAVGNLLIVALWDLLGDTVEGLDWVGRLLRAHGRVLPMAAVPLDITAQVEGADPDRPYELSTVRGQVACATTAGLIRSIALEPPAPRARPEAVAAVREADWVVLGPGSWFTSVLPHLLVPELADAILTTRARRAVVLNLAPQSRETEGFSPSAHLEVLTDHAPGLTVDVVLADRQTAQGESAGRGTPGRETVHRQTVHRQTVSPETARRAGARGGTADLEKTAALLGARLIFADVAMQDGTSRHDPARLAGAFAQIFKGE